MNSRISRWASGPVFVASLLVSACAGYSGSHLAPGISTVDQVVATMGSPALFWTNADGSEQLVYPRGPAGTQTFMAYIGPDRKLQRIAGVLNEANFALVQPGMNEEQVVRILGPSGPMWTQAYPRTNTLALSWLYCASGNFQNYFDVLFDATTGLVRSTSRSPVMVGRQGVTPSCFQENWVIG